MMEPSHNSWITQQASTSIPQPAHQSSTATQHSGQQNASPFKCEQCDKSYKNRGSLRAHRYNTHSDIVYPCPVSNKLLIFSL